MFKWITGNAYAMQATLYENNITLNASAANKLNDFRWCMIGFDENTKQMAIKGVSKHEIENNIVPSENLNKISIGKGYARISNKNIIKIAQEVAGRHCLGEKLSVVYDEEEKLLIVVL